MPKTWIPLVLVAFLGVAVAIVLFPTEEERALMYLKDKEFSEALDVYERMVQKGRLQPGPVKALSDLYIQYGEINKAIEILEQFSKENPENIDARARLGTYYQYAQRPGDYQTNLEKLVELEPTVERYKELADIYNFVGDYPKQIEVLKKLVQMPNPDPEAFVNIATLLVGQEKVPEAIAALEDLRNRYPKKVTADTLQFMLNLLLSNSREDDALKWAKEWFELFPLHKVALEVAELFSKKGQPRKALDILEFMEPHAGDDVTYQVTLLQYQYNNGKIADVFAKLKAMSEKTKLPAEAFPIFVELSLKAKDLAPLINEAKRQDITALDNDLLLRFVNQVTKNGDATFVDYVASRYEQNVLDNRPLFAAQLYYAGNRIEDTQKWVELALMQTNLSLEDNIKFTELLINLDNRDKALEKLAASEKELSDLPRPLQSWDYVLLAKNFISLSRVAEGVALFEKLRLATPSDALELGGVIIYAGNKQADDVRDWLKDQKVFDSFQLEDLHRVIIQTGDYELGLETAKTLLANFPGPVQRILYGRSLLHVEKNQEAADTLKEFIYQFPEAEGLYAVALSRLGNDEVLAAFKKAQEERAAGGAATNIEAFVQPLIEFKAYKLAFPYLEDLAKRVGKQWVQAYIEAGIKVGANKEIEAFLTEYMKKEDVPQEKKKEFVYVLIDIGGAEAAFPFIKKLAYEFDPEWGYLYVDMLKKKNNKEELRAFLKEWGLRPDTPREVKNYAAYELLEGGMKETAEKIYMELAKDGGPRDPEAMELRYIWGAKREPYRVQWLLDRVDQNYKTGNYKNMGQWLNYVNGYADPSETTKYLNRIKRSPYDLDMKVVKAYLKSLYYEKKFNVLDSEVMRAVTIEGEPDDLLEIAELSESLSIETPADQGSDRYARASEIAYRRVLEKEPNNRLALRRLGMLAFNHSRLSEAEQILRTYVKDYGIDDYEAHYFIGEALFFTDRKQEAEIYYVQAIDKMKFIKSNPVVDQIRANIRERFGYTGDAVETYESIRQIKPADEALQADYALILIDSGREREMMTRHMLRMH